MSENKYSIYSRVWSRLKNRFVNKNGPSCSFSLLQWHDKSQSTQPNIENSFTFPQPNHCLLNLLRIPISNHFRLTPTPICFVSLTASLARSPLYSGGAAAPPLFFFFFLQIPQQQYAILLTAKAARTRAPAAIPAMAFLARGCTIFMGGVFRGGVSLGSFLVGDVLESDLDTHVAGRDLVLHISVAPSQQRLPQDIWLRVHLDEMVRI